MPGTQTRSFHIPQRGRQRALTIEVDTPRGTVCQVRRKCNRLPSANERVIVERWAAVEGLNVAEAIRIESGVTEVNNLEFPHGVR